MLDLLLLFCVLIHITGIYVTSWWMSGSCTWILTVLLFKVLELRQELEARSLSSKGLKSQLIARLTKKLRVEQGKEEKGNKEVRLI